MEIIIKIKAEDVVDIKQHLSIIREQIIFALKNPSTIEGPIGYEGVGSKHSIEITLD